MPDETKVNAYKKDNIRVANLLAQLNGQKMLIMEPEFNKRPVVDSNETQHQFATIIGDAIDTIKAKNPELLVSLSMTDTGSRSSNNTMSSCGYENCALGDVSAWKKPEVVFNDLNDKLDFISFHQMMGQFSRDFENLGGWDTPNPRKFSDEDLGIEFLANRISNFSKYLHKKYNKPIFLPYIGIMTATWEDNNSDNIIQESEIDYNGWADRANNTYRKLSNLKSELLEHGLFGFAPMALFDNPRHDYGGYQYFMNNEYHLGIVGSSATDEVSIASYGDLEFKENILDYIFTPESLPREPIVDMNQSNYTISQVTPSGTVVATINAMDYQDDVLTYAITNTSPFEIDNRGDIMINGVLEPISYRLDIEVSDDEHSVAVQLRVHVK